MRKMLFIFYVILNCNAVGAQARPVTITVHCDKPVHEIQPGFWGSNFLYWIDDDSALADGKLVNGIREAGVRLLRYPGGTIADNFHWKTATLDNPNMFPFQSGEAETSFEEFIEVCRQTGAEAMCVLNTESWAVKKDLPGGAHEAAEWLRYCIQRKFRVKYWEIGNETYWHPVMSAHEYAQLVNIYADSLKKVDPTIILGINGHWDTAFVGTKERIKKEQLNEVLYKREHISSVKDYRQYEALVKAETELPVTKGSEKWWKILAEKCGDRIDMIIVHWYFSPKQLDIVSGKLSNLKSLLTAYHPQKKYIYNMSEFNVNYKTPESFMHLTEMTGLLLQAGYDVSAIWPMRMDYKKPTLLHYQSQEASIYNQIFRRLSTNLKGQLVKTVGPNHIPVFASHQKGQTTVVLTGLHLRADTSVRIALDQQEPQPSVVSIWRIKGEEFNYQMEEIKASVEDGGIHCILKPAEVLIASFK